MNCILSSVTSVLVVMAFGAPAFAERAWGGHIHLVDSNVVMVFDGLEYGTWHHVGGLSFPARGRISGGRRSVGFQIAADKDNPLQATIRGTVEIVVDREKAMIKELRFVRKHKYADWAVDPKIIEELKKGPNQDRKGGSQSVPGEDKRP